MPSLFHGKDGYAQQPATWADDTLYVGDAEVMQSWETPLMQFMVDEAVATHHLHSTSGPTVLEVGWGMGISGTRLMGSAAQYTVIEPHPAIAADAERRGAVVLPGFWQDVESTLPDDSFDIVFFDTYPLTRDEAGRDFEPFFAVARRLLRPRGVFTFYSDQKDSFDPALLATLLDLFSSVQLTLVRDLAPPKNQYWKHSTMVAPFCIK